MLIPTDILNEAECQSRLAFGLALAEMAKIDNSIVAIAADSVDLMGLRSFQKLFPERFFDVGIAEQNAMGIASGLATTGLKPFVTSSLQIAENIQEFSPVEINLDEMLNEPWNLFIINQANIVSSDVVYNCVKLLRENNKRIPETFNSLIANTINRLIGMQKEETTFVDLVNLQSLKNLKKEF